MHRQLKEVINGRLALRWPVPLASAPSWRPAGAGEAVVSARAANYGIVNSSVRTPAAPGAAAQALQQASAPQFYAKTATRDKPAPSAETSGAPKKKICARGITRADHRATQKDWRAATDAPETPRKQITQRHRANHRSPLSRTGIATVGNTQKITEAMPRRRGQGPPRAGGGAPDAAVQRDAPVRLPRLN